MAFQHFGKGTLRVVKNYTHGYSHTQTKVRDVTSNDPWPPSGRAMHEIAQLTYNPVDFVEIMEVMDKRLNDKGKYWRHVFKSLVLLDYLLHSGSENVIMYFRNNLYVIKTLREFQYVDEDDKDQGQNVRQKAKDITNLLMDDKLMQQERRNRAQMYQRMRGRRSADDDDDWDDRSNSRSRSLTPVAGHRHKEDEDLHRALEESKRSVAQERATAEEKDIQRAIKLSQAEEERMAKALAGANSAALFDVQNQLPPTVEGQLIDASLPLQYTSNVQPQYTAFQPQMTSLQPQYTSLQPQFTSVQPQFTAMQPQFTSIQPQFSSFNPWQQQAQEEAMQVEWILQQQAQAQQEEWLRQQQLLQQQQQPLVAQPTAIGSNNPFAHGPSASAPPLQPQQTSSPMSFNLQGTYVNRETAASAPPAPSQPQSTGQRMRADQTHANLADLFAARGDDGSDTFGNAGMLRFGYTQAGRLAAQRTGPASHNPFSLDHLSSQKPLTQT
ncbi:ENTH-domain-containing protein [Sparassis crispa]|uniref:ENTH-domain-containing protein n=1 Tax=Sparassis crispa TaxID=139825 RepID=A0A401G4Y7_9APHY|nr:ENTH-domain-containing protein [Sparassis crispa]GBE77225.1 ENTH-domain-containing protein [Sparassis crispa]